jgi:hypothetical protein
LPEPYAVKVSCTVLAGESGSNAADLLSYWWGTHVSVFLSLQRLCCINPRTRKVNRYTITDGLPINQFNYSSACRKPDGELFFGTINGVISFHPEQVHPVSPYFRIALTGIWSNNKQISANSGKAYFSSSISEITEITLLSGREARPSGRFRVGAVAHPFTYSHAQRRNPSGKWNR